MLFKWLVKRSYRASEVVMESLSDLEKPAMLHANDNYAFRIACVEGHLEIAKWLWIVCSDIEQSTMLHAKDNWGFLFGLSEWSSRR